MERMPVPGEIYQHFKGNLYRIVTLAQHTETDEKLVVYQALYGEFGVYARPLDLFLSEVDHAKYPDVPAKYRFTLIPAPGAPTAEICREERSELHRENTADRGQAKIQCPPENREEQNEEFQLDPALLAFLEADSYEKKLEVFAALAGKADEDMLNTIAVSLDLELAEGSIEEKYETLKNCLLTLEKYECSRLR